MTQFDILMMPDQRLRQVATPVDKVDASITQLVKDMLETMYAADGAGLAAPQIGVSKRVYILDLSDREEAPDPIVFINPKIVWSSKEEISMPEGCLSLPGLWLDLFRPKEVEVEFLDEKGREKSLKTDGWLARGIQHEGDHLDGVTTLSKFSLIKQKMLLAKSAKIQRRTLLNQLED